MFLQTEECMNSIRFQNRFFCLLQAYTNILIVGRTLCACSRDSFSWSAPAYPIILMEGIQWIKGAWPTGNLDSKCYRDTVLCPRQVLIFLAWNTWNVFNTMQSVLNMSRFGVGGGATTSCSLYVLCCLLSTSSGVNCSHISAGNLHRIGPSAEIPSLLSV